MSSGPVNPTQASESLEVGGVYNAQAPALTNKQTCALQVDPSGNLLVNIAVGTTIQPVSGTVTANQGTASLPSTAGWPVMPWGMADTLFASGLVTNPAAGAAIATLTTPPAGTYRVDVYSEAATGADMELRKGVSVLVSFLGSSGPFQPLKDIRITVDGATNISINATVGGAASGAYIAQIMATRIF